MCEANSSPVLTGDQIATVRERDCVSGNTKDDRFFSGLVYSKNDVAMRIGNGTISEVYDFDEIEYIQVWR